MVQEEAKKENEIILYLGEKRVESKLILEVVLHICFSNPLLYMLSIVAILGLR